MNEESIFAAALAIPSEAERRKFLDEACKDNAALRAGVEELLQASDHAGSFLCRPAADVTIDASADGDTHDSAGDGVSLPFLQPCETPGRIGKLGHYEIIEVVGQGGMGAVLRAFDTKLVRVVAVKVMAPELAANPTAVKRFLREAQSAAAVHHDHVVTIHGVEETHRPPYLVMQYVEGQTLQQKIEREGALELRQVLRIGSQMAAGLAAAHKHGLIHRDVKPGNILLENGVERVKITDFGLARAADDIEMTQPGMIAGTPQYMSPEQARGEAIDTRSDLFSLGSVLYTMCTGRPAFRAETTLGVLKRVCEDNPRPIREIQPQTPPWLEAIVGKLLAKDPEHRFQTAAEVAELLSQHLAHVQNPGVAPRPTTVIVPPASPPPPRHAAWVGKPPQPPLAPPSKKGSSVAYWLAALAVAGVLGVPLLLVIAYFFLVHSTNPPKFAQRGAATAMVKVEAPPPVDLTVWGRSQDPVGNCRLERQPDHVRFTTPGGLSYNLTPLYSGGMNAPRLVQEVQGDFVIQAAVAAFPRSPASSGLGETTASWRSAGVVVLIDHKSLLRLERVSWAERRQGAPRLHAEWFSNGQRLGDMYLDGVLLDQQPAWLRVERSGNLLRLLWSDDGQAWRMWMTVSDLLLPETLTVGLGAVHTTRNEFTVVVEDVRFTGNDAEGSAAAPLRRIPGWGATWSPDSRFVVRHDSTVIEQLPTGSLEKFELATGVSTPIAPKGKDPNWSPVQDGPIAYVIEPKTGQTTVWVCQQDGADRRAVSNGYFICGWSPDGSQLYDHDIRNRRIRAIDWKNSPPTSSVLFTFPEAVGSYPAVSPDGRMVAAATSRPSATGGKTLAVVIWDIASGAEIASAPAAGSAGQLIGWSPDSRRLAYGDYGYTKSGLWIFDLERREARKALHGNFTFPRWSPDGRYLSVDAREAVEVLVFAVEDLDPWKPAPQDAPTTDAASPPTAKASLNAEEAKALQEAWAQKLKLPAVHINSLEMKLRLIPPGEFSMGAHQADLEALIAKVHGETNREFLRQVEGEFPPRRVLIRQPFYLAECEVTVAQFRRFVEATGYVTDGERSGDGGWSGRAGEWVRHKEHVWRTPGEWPLADEQPVVHMSASDAQVFCDWLSKQESRHYYLPNEAQWEFAARAGGEGLFGASDDPDSLETLAWYKHNQPEDSRNQPQGVGKRGANPFGLYDMLGNVWEWTDTRYRGYSDRRVLRGGAWYCEALEVRPAARGSGVANMAWDAGTGFRVALAIP